MKVSKVFGIVEVCALLMVGCTRTLRCPSGNLRRRIYEDDDVNRGEVGGADRF